MKQPSRTWARRALCDSITRAGIITHFVDSMSHLLMTLGAAPQLKWTTLSTCWKFIAQPPCTVCCVAIGIALHLCNILQSFTMTRPPVFRERRRYTCAREEGLF